MSRCAVTQRHSLLLAGLKKSVGASSHLLSLGYRLFDARCAGWGAAALLLSWPTPTVHGARPVFHQPPAAAPRRRAWTATVGRPHT
eukprot:scaffold5184_cov121-Isochrysis_galbana.AAC.5